MWPPQVGQSFTQISKFNAKKAVAAGSFQIDTKLNGITVDTKKGDYCQFGDVSCPTATGDVSITNTGVFPSSAPSGSYQMRTLTKTNDTGATIFCYVVSFNI